jgi:uncharacterized MAPEG superfamily protein
MPIYVWVLVAFAVWTFILLFGPLGARRYSHRLAGGFAQAGIPDWYARARQAHLNCLENLPLFGAIVLAAVAARVSTPVMDGLAMVVILARVVQSVTHVALPPSRLNAAVRFFFFCLQAAAFLVMIYIVADSALHYQRLGR